MRLLALLLAPLLAAVPLNASPPMALTGTAPLHFDGDPAAAMVEGLDRLLTRETAAARERREAFWRRDLSSPGAYARSVSPNRERLRRILGVVDPRPAFDAPEAAGPPPRGGLVARGAGYRVYAVRWPALPGVDAEGLLLEPVRTPVAAVVALPECDDTPEALAGLAPGVPPAAQFARRLAESGCRVLVPALLDRRDTFSGNPRIRMTNQPHREFVYRAAFELGRHVIGYELQKVLAGVDWLSRSGKPVGAAGYGEGALLAFHAAALDDRIRAALVSGYFGPREELWRQPIYRNVWRYVREFGDAEVASLVAPRALTVEHSRGPEVSGPPPAREGRSGAAPGALTTPPAAAVRAEVERARALTRGLRPEPALRLVESPDLLPGSEAALSAFLSDLDPKAELRRSSGAAAPVPASPLSLRPPDRTLAGLVALNERLMRSSPERRAEAWAGVAGATPEAWKESCRKLRDRFWDEVIGRYPAASAPANPRSRLLFDRPAYLGYEVMLDVWPDVFAYGILLLPKGMAQGERRPAVVCQHGLEGRPADVADATVDHPAYHAFAARLAERGYVVFAPQNPYIGGDRFRVLQRKANPLGWSLFSFIVRQHERILEWLGAQPFVDPDRIAFYGLSYGGKTAMRVPALLEQYCLSICSADYNEWVWKNVTSESPYSYLFTGEYEMPEWDLASVCNYAEMSWLICPRPFMVERGHDDGVAPDEWVAYEYARTRLRYDRLGIGERTEIEFFNGPHTIHGAGTFAFLDRHLRGTGG